MPRVPVVRAVLPHGVALVLLHNALVIDIDQGAADAVLGSTAVLRGIADLGMSFRTSPTDPVEGQNGVPRGPTHDAA